MALSNIACRRLLNSGLSSVHHLKRGGPASVSKNNFFLCENTLFHLFMSYIYMWNFWIYIFLHLNNTDVLDYLCSLKECSVV